MEFVMLFFSAIIIVCIVGNKLSARIGVPSLLICLLYTSDAADD